MLKIKEVTSTEELCNGMDPVFKMIVKTISELEKDQAPDLKRFGKIIMKNLFNTKDFSKTISSHRSFNSSGSSNSSFEHELDLFSFQWNELYDKQENVGKFSNIEVIKIKNQLPPFRYAALNQYRNGKLRPAQIIKIDIGYLMECIYKGEWLHDVPNGRGMMIMDNGDIREGQFKNGLPDGHGRWINGNKLCAISGNYIGFLP